MTEPRQRICTKCSHRYVDQEDCPKCESRSWEYVDARLREDVPGQEPVQTPLPGSSQDYTPNLEAVSQQHKVETEAMSGEPEAHEKLDMSVTAYCRACRRETTWAPSVKLENTPSMGVPDFLGDDLSTAGQTFSMTGPSKAVLGSTGLGLLGKEAFGNYRYTRSWWAQVPMIPPIGVRLAGGGSKLRHHVVLWEAEWSERRPAALPPYDPYLLRPLGGDLYAVVSEWDLTEIERAVMAGRTAG